MWASGIAELRVSQTNNNYVDFNSTLTTCEKPMFNIKLLAFLQNLPVSLLFNVLDEQMSEMVLKDDLKKGSLHGLVIYTNINNINILSSSIW